MHIKFHCMLCLYGNKVIADQHMLMDAQYILTTQNRKSSSGNKSQKSAHEMAQAKADGQPVHLIHRRKRKQVSGISQLVELVKAQSVDQQAAMASMNADKMQRLDRLLYILAKK